MPEAFDLSREAAELDRDDELAGFRGHFHLPKSTSGDETIYFCGHSLGLQPRGVRGRIEEMLRDWSELGVEGHFRARMPWMPYHEFVVESLAKIIGAEPPEVVAMNSLTVNLHLMMVSFYRPTAQRERGDAAVGIAG